MSALPVASRRARRWHAPLRVIRPLVLTSLAAVAFAALLRWHHMRFEDSLVHRFQHYQMNTAQSMAAALSETFDDVLRSFSVVAASAEIVRGDPAAGEVLDAFYRKNAEALDYVVRLDPHGQVLSQSPASAEADIAAAAEEIARWKREGAGEGGPRSVRAGGNRVLVTAPLRRDGDLTGAVCAGVNIRRLAVKCLWRAQGLRTTCRWVIAPDGDVLRCDGRPEAAPLRVHRTQPNAETPGIKVPPRDLVPYAVERAIALGLPALAHASAPGGQEELISVLPVSLGEHRYALVLGSPKAEISVPISSHERVTYTLIGAMALLYFATGYLAYRGEAARLRYEKERRRAAEEASSAKGEFLARMSHELRTPLAGILGMTELALGPCSRRERHRYLNTVKDSADSLLAIINDILDFSKIEARRMELQAEPFLLEEFLAGSLAPLEPLARKKGLSLRWAVEGHAPPALVGDPCRLRQVLTNLVGNAVKFTSAGGVEVGVRLIERTARGARLGFRVRDTGIGIEPQVQVRLFEAFSQGRAPGQCSPYLAAPQGGTGLGLAIAKRLTELMGGTIWLQSRPGEGSTFFFTACFALPGEATGGAAECRAPGHVRWRSGSEDGRMEPDAAAGPGTGRLSILLVDDNPVNQEVSAVLMRRWGHSVEVASSGPEALRLLEVGGYDLVFMDVQLPGMDGLELTAEIRRREEALGGGRVPIVAMTAHARPSDRELCLRSGMDEYLCKPVRPAELMAAIDRVLAGRTSPAPPARTPAATAEARLLPAWDITDALGHVGGDTANLMSLVRIFLGELEEIVPVASAAARAGRWQELSALAHRLKGSLATLAAKRAQSLASGLEEICAAQPRRAAACWKELARELGALRGRMAAALEKHEHASIGG